MDMTHNTDSIIALAAAIREQANALLIGALSKRGILDLLPAHGAVLHALFQQCPLPMGTLAEAIGRKKNTVTGLINTLEERGYCRRKSAPQDARMQMIVLTDKGEKLREIQAEISKELLQKTWKGFSEQEKNSCIHSLRKVLDNLKHNESF